MLVPGAVADRPIPVGEANDAFQWALDGLRSAHGFLQARVATELTLKHTPALVFEYDESVDRGMRITELIKDEDD